MWAEVIIARMYWPGPKEFFFNLFFALFCATGKSPSVFKRLLQSRVRLFWQTKFIRQAKYEGEDVKSEAAEMIQVFRSVQGIQRDSFTICLFLLQDITLQAVFFFFFSQSFGSLSQQSRVCMRRCNFLRFIWGATISPCSFGAQTCQKVKVCIRPSNIWTWEASRSVCEGAADFPVRRAG